MRAAGDGLRELTEGLQHDLGQLERELDEIALLEQQVRVEAERHEQRRQQSADRLSLLDSGRLPPELRDAMSQLVAVTRRSSLMQAQIDVLEGKRRSLERYRDRVRSLLEDLAAAALAVERRDEPRRAGGGSRAVINAQEDLRREIARLMHDGPAQSLTNIALQAQIVQRLMDRDPQVARGEVLLLVEMVERTLAATKDFIFDVRPMVLDDLGLVPTLRRATYERSRRSGVPIAFDSNGSDRRLPPDLESACFRIVDDALAGFLTTAPATLSLRLDWTETDLRIQVARGKPGAGAPTAAADDAADGGDARAAEAPPDASRPSRRFAWPARRDAATPVLAEEPVPPALAALIAQETEEREAEATARAQADAERRALPQDVWEEIEDRAAAHALDVDLSEDGVELEIRVDLPERARPD